MRLFFRHREHEVPGLNTSSLPDLIFTVLFFFMIVTHMRDVDLKVRYQVPQGTELKKQGHKGSIIYIYVGKKISAKEDSEFFIQLNNEIATIADIKEFIEQEREKMNAEDRQRMTVSIKADRDVPMGIIADIKKELQLSSSLKINYSATEK
ncbi:ExbD/TolR family protein [Prevotella sp. E13-27]|uniref:ExbD/TolR family protein n=1 Tax=Prevotella sp. E13-27 TaxID=2938122 RepID=UPI00200ACB1F|nr:biopolymer transporter ExbD [Prevotella sp. E13-27]MBQ7662691.1 biopolymer transporter ExbD [Prevotella sp.]MCK8622663.1 biopolymer transporter ExbD [Prevotella sp. E13-27]